MNKNIVPKKKGELWGKLRKIFFHLSINSFHIIKPKKYKLAHLILGHKIIKKIKIFHQKHSGILFFLNGEFCNLARVIKKN